MSLRHTARHEEILRGWITTESDPRALLDRSGLAACPLCPDRLDELLGAEDRSGGDASRERRPLSFAEILHGAPGKGPVAAIPGSPLAEEEPETADDPRRAPWLSLLLAVVAGSIMLAIFIYDPWGGADETFGAEPGQSSIVIDFPSGAVEAWDAFVWEGNPPQGGWYVVQVRDADGTLIDRSPRLHQPLWTPAEEESAKWPRHIRWEVRLFHPSTAHLDSAFAEAWLR